MHQWIGNKLLKLCLARMLTAQGLTHVWGLPWPWVDLGCFGGFKVKVSRHSQETGKFRFGLGLSNSPSLAILLNPDLLRRPTWGSWCIWSYLRTGDRDVTYLPLLQSVSQAHQYSLELISEASAPCGWLSLHLVTQAVLEVFPCLRYLQDPSPGGILYFSHRWGHVQDIYFFSI